MILKAGQGGTVSESVLVRRFKAMDADGSGKLTSKEIMDEVPGADRYKAGQILAVMDVDSDGLVSYVEFLESYYEESSVGVVTAADMLGQPRDPKPEE